MRHHNSKRKFGRQKDQRVALLRSLANNFFERGFITTSLPKAKELRPFVEKLITRAKVGSIASRRMIASRINSKKIASKIVKVVALKYKDRKGGYTRITRLAPRASDASQRAKIELV